jgi:polyphosphate kinase
VAPEHLRDDLVAHIDRVTERHEQGQPGHIRMKLNSMIDGRIIQSLFRASGAGVPVEMCVRGICGFVPGIPDVSENIRVTSVVGRFLEHSRIFVFTSGDERVVLTGSADLMARNLDDRVELVAPVDDPGAADELVGIVDTMLADTACAWRLHPDRSWERVAPAPGERPFSSQQALMDRAAARPEATPRDDR